MKQEVLNADPALLRQLGRHFIVGYRDPKELRELVAHGAIGGIFISAHNIAGKSFAEVRREIDALQRLQALQGLPPLWVATDQEGGLVSKLSPLARALPTLGEWIQVHGQEGIEDFARIQAEDLRGLGINVNFSPVVDLQPEAPANPLDRHTQIGRRAIAADWETVSAAGLHYCRALNGRGVMPTLKHFPGLGTVDTDTHLRLGRTSRNWKELREQDWLPFQNILSSSDAFLMLGHVLIPGLDEEQPASLSRKVVQKILRREWGFDGVTITDDFAMGPIYGGPGSVEAAAPRALNAGVDLLLFSYDGDLYYPAMRAVLRAQVRGALAQGFLEQSVARLARARQSLQGGSHEEMGNVHGRGFHSLVCGLASGELAGKPLLRDSEAGSLGSGLGAAAKRLQF